MDSKLARAARLGDLERVRRLLELGAQPDYAFPASWSILMKAAAAEGGAEVVHLLVHWGAEVNYETPGGLTALMIAAKKGHGGTVQALLDRGAEIDNETRRGWTALMRAAAEGHAEVVDLLLRGGAEVDRKNRSGQTARMLAAELGHAEVVALLDAPRASPEGQSKPDATGEVSRATAVRCRRTAGGRSPSSRPSGLHSAIKKAVTQGQEEYHQLQSRVAPVLASVEQDVGQIRDLCSTERLQGMELVSELRGLCERLEGHRASLSQVFTAQQGRLKEFNIVLFGRTGAGKSTLIEALRHGDGATISDGRSDYTTEVSGHDWDPCVLWDTPGIEGWGRSTSRVNLERRAIQAAQAADLVILAFDNSNQQDSEFQKIARWVLEFGKPALAILNCRNPLWRHPVAPVAAADRKAICLAVRQHAGRIREALSQRGLDQVTLVALHAQRAWEARTQVPTPSKRAGIPPENLECSSNIQALETLLEQTLLEHASDLRMGMLRSEARAVLDHLGQEFERTGRQLEALRRPLFSSLVELIRLVGLEEIPAQTRLSRAETEFRELIRLLEELKERDHSVPCSQVGRELEGDFQRWLREALRGRLTPLRDEAVTNVVRIIDEAFDEGKAISEEQARKKAIPEAALQREVKALRKQAQEYLARRLEKIRLDFSLDLRCEFQMLGGAETDIGYLKRILAHVARLGEYLGKIAALFPPFRWIGTAASWAFNWIRGRATRSSQEDRRKEQSRVEREATAELHSVFDRQIRENLQEATASVRTASRGRLRELALLCRLCCSLEDRVQKSLRSTLEVRESLPEPAAPPAVLFRSTRERLEQEASTSSTHASRLLWLGEAWAHEEAPPEPNPWKASESKVFRGKQEREARIVSNLLRTAPPGLDVEAVREVCRMLCSSLPEGQRQPVLQATARLDAPSPCPRVLLVGDYNTGKTSWIRRLRMEFGASVEGLDVGAAPTTSACAEASVGWLSFVDTPGFGSGETGHEAAARAAIAATTWTLVFLSPTLGEPGMRLLSQVLQAAREADPGFSPGRCLLVMNRSDEIGDPDVAPQGYLERLKTKRDELRHLLKHRMPEWQSASLVFMAAAPYGSGSPDTWRAMGTWQWDGFVAWLDLLRAAPGHTADAQRLVAREVLLEGLWGAAESQRLLEEEAEQVQTRLEALQSLLDVVDRTLKDSRALWGSCFRTLEGHVQDRTCTEREKLRSALDQKEAEAAVKGAEEVLGSKEMTQILEIELQRSAERVQKFIESQEQALQRRLQAASMASQVHGRFSGRGFGPRGPGRVGSLLKSGLGLGSGLRGISRETVRALLHKVGHKSKPWGIVKKTKLLNKIGVVMGVVDLGVDVVEDLTGAEAKRARQFRASCQKEEQAMLQAIRRWVRTAFHGTAAEPGVGGHLGRFRRELRGWAAGWRAEAAALKAQQDELRRTRASLDRAISQGQRLLATSSATSWDRRNEG